MQFILNLVQLMQFRFDHASNSPLNSINFIEILTEKLKSIQALVYIVYISSTFLLIPIYFSILIKWIRVDHMIIHTEDLRSFN